VEIRADFSFNILVTETNYWATAAEQAVIQQPQEESGNPEDRECLPFEA
jgi:hypothetical protein